MSEEKKASNTDKNVEETASKDSIKESQEAKTSASETQEASTTQEEELVTESIDVIKDAKTNDANEEEHDEDFVAEDEEDDQDSDPDDLDAALNEDSEDESASERHDIPKKDYDSLSKEELIKEFKYLLNNHKVQAIKEHVTELRAAFISQFEDEQEQAKEKFLEEGGNIIDFRYYSPLKKEFNSLYFDYRDKRNNYYKNLKKDLNANLETRNALIEELLR